MATSSWSLVVLLVLLSSVVASQAYQVSCTNSCKKAMSFNGISTGQGMTTLVEVAKEIKCEVYDLEGVKHVVKYKCPGNVIGVEFLCEGGLVKAKITEIRDVGSTGDSAVNTERLSDLDTFSMIPGMDKIHPLNDGFSGEVFLGVSG